MEFGQKKICEIDLFDFTSFFGLDVFKFSGPLYYDERDSLFTADNWVLMGGYFEKSKTL